MADLFDDAPAPSPEVPPVVAPEVTRGTFVSAKFGAAAPGAAPPPVVAAAADSDPAEPPPAPCVEEGEEASVTPAVVAWQAAWDQAERKLSRLAITVDKPEQHGTALSRYVTYRVSTKVVAGPESAPSCGGDEFVVSRRFSEFVSLRDALEKRYAGLLVPPIPPKVLVLMSASKSATENSALTRSRTRILALFMERLGTLPWTSDDSVLRAFVGCGEHCEVWTKALAADEKAPADESLVIHCDESTTTGRGRALWYATVARSPARLPDHLLDKLVLDVQPRLDALINAHESAVKAFAKSAASCNARADGINALCEGVAPWRGESARWSALSLLGTTLSEDRTERSAAAVSSAVRSWGREAALESAALDHTAGAALQWQALGVVAMRDLLAKRASLLDELRRDQKILAQLHAAKAGGGRGDASRSASLAGNAKGFFASMGKGGNPFSAKDSASTLEDEIAKTSKACSEHEAALEHHAKALVYCEIERFHQDYASFAALWTSRFFAAQKQLALRQAAVWDEAREVLGAGVVEAPDTASALVWDATAAERGNLA